MRDFHFQHGRARCSQIHAFRDAADQRVRLPRGFFLQTVQNGVRP